MLSRLNRLRMFIKGTPVSSMFATILGIVSAALFIATAIISMAGSGNAGMIIGVMGVFAMILNVVGFALAAGSTKGEKEMRYGLPLFAVLFNGVMFIIYLIFYLYGFLISL